jgi:ABC-type ATPase with predicted acetyltransferase domain
VDDNPDTVTGSRARAHLAKLRAERPKALRADPVLTELDAVIAQMIRAFGILRSVSEAARAASNELRYAIEHAREVADAARMADSAATKSADPG